MARALPFVVAVIALVCAASAAGQAPFGGAPFGGAPAGGAPGSEAGAPPDHELAQRWRALSPERRAELARRYEQLRAMPDGEREALVARARELQRIEADVLDELSSEQRARFDAMPAETRRGVVHELVLQRARERAERLREALPTERLEALQRGDRRERERALGDLRREHERELPRRIRAVGTDLGLPEAELGRLVGLPHELQRRELAELVRRRFAAWVAENGPPPGVDPAEVERLLAAPPDVFARRYGRVRERVAELGLLPELGADSDGRGGRPDGPRFGPPREGRPDGGRPEGGRPDGGRRDGGQRGRDDGGRGGDPAHAAPPPWARSALGGRPRGDHGLDSTGAAWLQRLRAASAPTVAERLELADLPAERRDQVLGERVRERVLGVLRELGATEAELEPLRTTPLTRLRRATHELLLARFRAR